jgi:class 3 adenylate cyclase/alpha-beta hydrolase superfamily lysophospholipase
MTSTNLPETRFAQSGDVSIAYQVMGDGPADIVYVPGLVSNLELFHEIPGYTDFFDHLARFARVVMLDKRGQGLSDRIVGAPTLEQRADDVRSVMDAVGMKRVALIGNSEGAALVAYFAATYPESISHLIIMAGLAKFARSEAFPWGATEKVASSMAKYWGTGRIFRNLAPSTLAGDDQLAGLARYERQSCSPGNFRALLELNMKLDVLAILPQIRVPTLIIHRTTDQAVPLEAARHTASLIPGAKIFEQSGGDHFIFGGDYPALCTEIEEFVTGERREASAAVDRVLATVLFTDIVDSTSQAAAIGDAAWRRKLDEHDRIARRLIDQHRGRLIKMTGDGVLAMFDGPGRAIRCALGMEPALARLQLSIRAGLHTGEVEERGEDIGGIAVHAASRVMSNAGPGEVLVSRVVADLVAGSGISFTDRGEAELKGIPGTWRLFAASV